MTGETTTPTGTLWRIAELASRSSDPRWRGDRRQAMADLEAAISEIGARLQDCASGRHQAAPEAREAGAQGRSAHGDSVRERAAAEALRAREKRAREELAACRQALEAAQADREDDLRRLRRAHHELSTAQASLTRAEVERDKARAALAAARSDVASAHAALASARAAAEEAEAGRLVAQRERRTVEMERDAAISLLNSVPAREIDLRGAESTSEEPRAAEVTEDTGGATVVDLPAAPAGPPTRPRLLHVAATLGHLLPEDLESLLRPGVQVVRREGRLAALLAVPVTASAWAAPTGPSDEEQAEALQAAGFRVAWSTRDCLAS